VNHGLQTRIIPNESDSLNIIYDDENELSEAIDNLVCGIIRELRKELNNGDQESI